MEGKKGDLSVQMLEKNIKETTCKQTDDKVRQQNENENENLPKKYMKLKLEKLEAENRLLAIEKSELTKKIENLSLKKETRIKFPTREDRLVEGIEKFFGRMETLTDLYNSYETWYEYAFESMQLRNERMLKDNQYLLIGREFSELPKSSMVFASNNGGSDVENADCQFEGFSSNWKHENVKMLFVLHPKIRDNYFEFDIGVKDSSWIREKVNYHHWHTWDIERGLGSDFFKQIKINEGSDGESTNHFIIICGVKK